MKKAIFLDRDGIINIDKNYVFKISDFEFNSDIFNILQYLQSLNYILFIVTNQSGIGRGYYSIRDFMILNNWMLKKFNENGIEIVQVEYCPHHPNDRCICRKPKIGMVDKILKDFNIDLSKSWMIGDRISDISLAKNAGIKNSIRISSKIKKDFFSRNYFESNNLSFIKKVIIK